MEELYDKNGNVVNIDEVLNDKMTDLIKCNRVEVIDEFGRSYVNYNQYNDVKISIQDNCRTLKVFIKRDKNSKQI